LESSNPPATTSDVVKAFVIHAYLDNYQLLPVSNLTVSPPIFLYTDQLPLHQPYMSVYNHSFYIASGIGIIYDLPPSYWQFYKYDDLGIETASFFIWVMGF